MNVKAQLERLLIMQDLALEIQAARAAVAGAPGRIDEIEGRFRERNAEYVALRARLEELEADQRSRESDVALLEEALKKYQGSLMQVKNQREYAAMLKEIDTVKSKISAHEDVILKNMDEAGPLRTDLDARSSHIAEERARVAREHAGVDAEAAAARERIERAEADRSRIGAELPRDLLDAVKRVEEGRQGIFLAKAEKETCQACYVRVRPQVFQEIRQCLSIHSCRNCRRLLYYEPALRPQTPGPSAIDGDDAGLEAANGGTV